MNKWQKRFLPMGMLLTLALVGCGAEETEDVQATDGDAIPLKVGRPHQRHNDGGAERSSATPTAGSFPAAFRPPTVTFSSFATATSHPKGQSR